VALQRSRAPTLLGFDPNLQTIVTDEFPRKTIEDLVVAEEPERAAALAAGWIRESVSTKVTIGRPIEPLDSISKIRMRADYFQSDASAKRLSTILDSLEHNPPIVLRHVLVHGSMKLDHLHDCGDAVGLVDWDGYRQGPPEYDAATFLATAARIAAVIPSLSPTIEVVSTTFRHECADVLDPSTLQRFELLALAKAIGKLGQQHDADVGVEATPVSRLLDAAEKLDGLART
jgi:Phosphotransferase enzyme family